MPKLKRKARNILKQAHNSTYRKKYKEKIKDKGSMYRHKNKPAFSKSITKCLSKSQLRKTLPIFEDDCELDDCSEICACFNLKAECTPNCKESCVKKENLPTLDISSGKIKATCKINQNSPILIVKPNIIDSTEKQHPQLISYKDKQAFYYVDKHNELLQKINFFCNDCEPNSYVGSKFKCLGFEQNGMWLGFFGTELLAKTEIEEGDEISIEINNLIGCPGFCQNCGGDGLMNRTVDDPSISDSPQPLNQSSQQNSPNNSQIES